MNEPWYCNGCVDSRVYRHSGWECGRDADQRPCSYGSEYRSKGDAKLRQYPEERRDE